MHPDSDDRPLAVVTGASSGIGRELAARFARHGFDLVVCADDGRLADAAVALRRLGAETVAVRADLAVYDGVELLYRAVAATGRPVAAAALNAGIGTRGAFLDADLSDLARVIDLNVTSTTHLAHRLLPGMVAAGGGRLLVVSSVAALVPGPHQAVYGATKAYLRSLGEALRDELRGTGVTVTTLLPGVTDTDFFRRAGVEDTPLGRWRRKDDPALVAAQAYAGLMRGRRTVRAGSLPSRIGARAAALLPHALTAPALGYGFRPPGRRAR
ncbi:SDR family NAD(P)-dependent oxidoreductase [Streptomyces sp. enrichment culture]|uniref:SDR family NAD(P)-dependent oxidoreductase n=1 Tax=Streptomyces sp. enrichment culture TaxID=1795815 RepID=UPI003F548D84